MVPFRLRQALEACGGEYHGDQGLLDSDISDVTIDSRAAVPGALFVAIKGGRFDGHDFIEAALKAGAVCSVAERLPECGGSCILVPSALDAFQAIAAFYRALFRIPAVGITGSAGKTTTKELVSCVLEQKYRVLKNEGNLNNQTGVPITVFRLEKCHEAAVIEMGMNHFGEIRNLARIVRPDIGVITNIGEAHIEFLGSKEGILKAKTEMLEFMEPGGYIVVNGDDPLLAALASRYPNVVTVGLGENNLVCAEDISDMGLKGTRFTACFEGKRLPLYIHCPGEHMVINALAALAAGILLGVGEDKIQSGIAGYKPPTGRMHIVQTRDITVINDAYNANPSSMAASLGALAKAEGRTVCILGDMFELGENEAQYHQDIGRCAVDAGIDCILCVGKLAVNIYKSAKQKNCDARHFDDKEQLTAALPSLIRPGDTVLVKASHGMRLDTVAEWLIDDFSKY